MLPHPGIPGDVAAPQLACFVLPTRRQHPQHDLPIVRDACQDVIVHSPDDIRIAWWRSITKLALMPIKGEGFSSDADRCDQPTRNAGENVCMP